MKIPKENAEMLLNGTMKELWEAFIMLEGEYKEYDEDYDEARFGLNVKFDIYEIWEPEITSTIEKFNKNQKVQIGEKKYSLEEFSTEKEERRKIMVDAIYA